jgi:hypothetical protein
MFQIKDLLQKFKDVEDPNETKQRIAMAINQVIGVDLLRLENIEFKEKMGIVRINSNPAIRQRIFMVKEKCLDSLRSIFPKKTFVDIR